MGRLNPMFRFDKDADGSERKTREKNSSKILPIFMPLNGFVF